MARRPRRADLVLHLHRFEHQHDVAFVHQRAGRDEPFDDLGLQGRAQDGHASIVSSAQARPHNAAVRFYFDFVSPFGYFASLRIDDIAARHGREVEWRPMLLGVSVLKVMGLKPLLETPLKGDYLRRQIARHKRRHGLQLARSADDPMMDPVSYTHLTLPTILLV